MFRRFLPSHFGMTPPVAAGPRLGSGVPESPGPAVLLSLGSGDWVTSQPVAPWLKMQFAVPDRIRSYRATAMCAPLITSSTAHRVAIEARPAFRAAADSGLTGRPPSIRAIDQASTIAAARYTRATRLPTKTAIWNQPWIARPARSKVVKRTAKPATRATASSGGAANPSPRRYAPR